MYQAGVAGQGARGDMADGCVSPHATRPAAASEHAGAGARWALQVGRRRTRPRARWRVAGVTALGL